MTHAAVRHQHEPCSQDKYGYSTREKKITRLRFNLSNDFKLYESEQKNHNFPLFSKYKIRNLAKLASTSFQISTSGRGVS